MNFFPLSICLLFPIATGKTRLPKYIGCGWQPMSGMGDNSDIRTLENQRKKTSHCSKPITAPEFS